MEIIVNIKTLKITAFSCAAMAMSLSAAAGTVQDVTLTGVGCNGGSSTTCYANVDKDVGTCTNKRQLRWDGGTSSGKSITAAMLTAKASESLTNIGFVDGECFGGGTAFPALNFVTVK